MSILRLHFFHVAGWLLSIHCVRYNKNLDVFNKKTYEYKFVRVIFYIIFLVINSSELKMDKKFQICQSHLRNWRVEMKILLTIVRFLQ
jgi:hypothetical protein